MKAIQFIGFILCVAGILFISGCTDTETPVVNVSNEVDVTNVTNEVTTPVENTTQMIEAEGNITDADVEDIVIEGVPVTTGDTTQENLTVHFIDIGQGDAILLEKGGNRMLIDSGDIGKGDDVVTYLKSHNIDYLDYVVATHPHADHIGGMHEVLDAVPVSEFVDSGYPHTSATYTNMLQNIEDRDITFTMVKDGDGIEFSDGISVEVFNPQETYFKDDLNQNSVVLKVTDNNVSFLFAGDAGIDAENAMLANGEDLNSDILKVGHHGSSTSSSDAFLKAVSPDLSIISVGIDNDYGHPSKDALDRLSMTSEVIRTDNSGTVVVTTDGETYSFTEEK